MPGLAEVHVKKIGSVCKVYVNTETGGTLPLNNYDDKPVGGFPRTFSSPEECQSFYQGRKLVFLESPSSGNQITVDPVDTKVLQAELNKHKIEATPLPPRSTAEEPAATADSLHLSKSQEYLYMLTMACKYASDKNKKELAIKIETAEELIRHVFGK